MPNEIALQVARNVEPQQKGLQRAHDLLLWAVEKDEKRGLSTLRSELDELERLLSGQKQLEHEEQARKTFHALYVQYIEQWKNGLSDEALAQKFRAFLSEYAGTAAADDLLKSPEAPYPKLRELLEKVPK